MITDQCTSQSLERAAQFQASIGYLHCIAHEKLLSNKLICSIAFNILFASASVTAIALAATITLHIAAPIVLSVIAVGMLAFNIFEIKKRYLPQQEALLWKPVFETLLTGDYHYAFKLMRDEIERINQTFFQDEIFPDPEITMYTRLSLYNGYVFKAGIVPDRFFENLEFYIATLKELQPDPTPIVEVTYLDIERPARYMRVKGNDKLAIDFINRQTDPFKGTKVDNFAKLLFDEFLKSFELERVALENVRKRNPKYRQNFPHVGEELSQLKRLLAFGKELLDPKEVITLEDILACEAEDEIHLKVRDFLAKQY